MKKLLFAIISCITVLCGGTAFADNITCESDEILDNGVCVPVCDANTTNFEYTDPNTGTTTCIKNKFSVTTTNDTDTFTFSMSTRSILYVDWGDGVVEKIDRTALAANTKNEYSHNYSTTKSYTIKFGGEKPIGYFADAGTSAASPLDFGQKGNITYDKVAQISGSLGKLFPAWNKNAGNHPKFYGTFKGCINLTGAIPGTLFSGITVQPGQGMFYETFSDCTGITSIPENLFGDIAGPIINSLFGRTFYRCTGLTSIPPKLFQNFTGTAQGAFVLTFAGCTGLTGSIPGNLFSTISGRPLSYMFQETFSGCKNLTGTIPGNLFASISGAPAAYMFYETFANCSGLTGAIPANLFAGISGTPAIYMFSGTFRGCSGLTGKIPSNLFCYDPENNICISGNPVSGMFSNTFYGCSNIDGFVYPDGTTTSYIPPTFFENINNNGSSIGSNMFYGTKILSQCPENMYKYITGFESSFGGNKVSCMACPSDTPYSPAASTSIDQCYKVINLNWYLDENATVPLTVQPAAQKCIYGQKITLPDTIPTKPGYIFSG